MSKGKGRAREQVQHLQRSEEPELDTELESEQIAKRIKRHASVYDAVAGAQESLIHLSEQN